MSDIRLSNSIGERPRTASISYPHESAVRSTAIACLIRSANATSPPEVWCPGPPQLRDGAQTHSLPGRHRPSFPLERNQPVHTFDTNRTSAVVRYQEDRSVLEHAIARPRVHSLQSLHPFRDMQSQGNPPTVHRGHSLIDLITVSVVKIGLASRTTHSNAVCLRNTSSNRLSVMKRSQLKMHDSY